MKWKKPVDDPLGRRPIEDEAPPEHWFRFLGLVIVRKTDLLAGAAFLIAVSSTLYQIWGFVRGPEIEEYTPDVVYVFFDRYANGDELVRFAGQLSFVNSGDTGRNAVVRDASLQWSLGSLSATYPWASFSTVSRQSDRLNVTPRELAHPLAIAGSSAVSEMTAFAAFPSACVPKTKACDANANYISADRFLSAALATNALQLNFSARRVGSDKPMHAGCTVALNVPLVEALIANKWVSVACEHS